MILILQGVEKQIYNEYFQKTCGGFSGFPTHTQIKQLLYDKSYLPVFVCDKIWEQCERLSTRNALMDQNSFNILSRLIALAQVKFLQGQLTLQISIQDAQQQAPIALISGYEDVIKHFPQTLPNPLKLSQSRYAQLWTNLKSKFGQEVLTREQVLTLFRDSNLPHNTLDKILHLSCPEFVTEDQFAIGMFLIEFVLSSVRELGSYYQQYALMGMQVPQLNYDILLPNKLHPAFVPVKVAVEQKYEVKQLSMSPVSPQEHSVVAPDNPKAKSYVVQPVSPAVTKDELPVKQEEPQQKESVVQQQDEQQSKPRYQETKDVAKVYRDIKVIEQERNEIQRLIDADQLVLKQCHEALLEYQKRTVK